MSTSSDEELVREVHGRLSSVLDPCSVGSGSPLDLERMGMVAGVQIEHGMITIHLRMTTPQCPMGAYFLQQIEPRVREIQGVRAVKVLFDDGGQWTPDFMAMEIRQERAQNAARLRSKTITQLQRHEV